MSLLYFLGKLLYKESIFRMSYMAHWRAGHACRYSLNGWKYMGTACIAIAVICLLLASDYYWNNHWLSAHPRHNGIGYGIRKVMGGTLVNCWHYLEDVELHLKLKLKICKQAGSLLQKKHCIFCNKINLLACLQSFFDCTLRTSVSCTFLA